VVDDVLDEIGVPDGTDLVKQVRADLVEANEALNWAAAKRG
jgi:hypothetical protein